MNRCARCMVLLLGVAVVAAAVMVVLVTTGTFASVNVQKSLAAEAQAVDAAGEGSSGEGSSPLAGVIISADFAVKYSSLSQLTKSAEVIVRGKVTRVSYVDFNATTYTKTTLEVSECLKGGVAAGEKITIMEPGGVTSTAAVVGDKFGEPRAEDFAANLKVLFEGAPLSEVGDECLYFLGEGSIGVTRGTYYVSLGAFQGRFVIQDSVAERFVPADWVETGWTSLSMPESTIEEAVLRAEQEE